MVVAGSEIASEMITAKVAYQMDGLGGGLSWQQWCSRVDVDNRDLIVDYCNGTIMAVEAIYLAMERAK
jgi:hypothetical protein